MYRRVFCCFLYLALVSLAVFLLNCGGTTGARTSSPAQTSGATPQSSHVVIVLEENKSYKDVIGNSAMPFLNGLAQQYAYSTNYFANGANSLPNYFMMTTGQLVGDNNFQGTVSNDNVVRELTAAGKTWKVYAQSLPQAGYLGPSAPPYVKWHNPFVYFSDIVESQSQQSNVVPVPQFTTDLANNALPDYSFIVPDNAHNSHDCPPGMPTCSLEEALANADNWLRDNIGPLLNTSTFQQNGLLIIAYDESDENDTQRGGGHIPFVIAGPNVRRGYVSGTLYQHPSLLRLSLQTLGITTYPGAGASAPDMGEFFQ
jgi:acid phosphatase